MGNNPAGSIWNKWDLHIHTPASVVQHYGGDTDDVWDKYLEELESLPPEFKVIGINDYIFVDGYERVLKAKQSGRLGNIDLILPVIELRLDKFAGVVRRDKDGSYSKSDWNRINLHVIFDQIDPEVIRQQFLSALVQCYSLIPESAGFKSKWQAVITPASLTQLGQMIIDAAPADKKADYSSPLHEGFNNLCCSLESIVKALEKHDLANRVLLAVGKTEWENMKWDDQSIAEKRNLINSVDLVFTASENPEAYNKARAKLTAGTVLDKLLDCSDAHDFASGATKDKIGRCFTWIKADPTFEGLRQAVTEFDQRVYIGDTPPKQLLASSNRTKYVSSVKVKKRVSSTLADTWFDVDIPLNHDLVAIIGNKGSGKSALADVIALAGDTRNYESFSFLSDHRFRDPRSKLASHFVGTLGWHDTTSSAKELHENPSDSSVERIKYLPQSYLETLCNELAASGTTTFDGELRKIIYTHVPEEERFGYLSLDDLLDFKISELESERKLFAEDLSRVNTEIVEVERKLTPPFRQGLEQQLENRRKELIALEGAKPEAIEDPQESGAAKQEAAQANAAIEDLEKTLAGIQSQEAAARQKKGEAVRGSVQLARVLQSLRNYQKSHEHFVNELVTTLAGLQVHLNADDIVSLTINFGGLEAAEQKMLADSFAQDELLAAVGEKSLPKARGEIDTKIKAIKSQLGEKQRLFLVYRERLAKWEKDKTELQGTVDKPNSIAWFGAEIDALVALPARRDALKAERVGIVRSLHQQIEKMVKEYKVLYQPVQAFVQSTAKMDMPLPLDFDVRIAEDGFQESFLERINRQVRGSFSGVEESSGLVHTFLRETDFSNENSVVALVEKIDDLLHFDRREGADNTAELSVLDQLRKGHRPDALYDFVFGLEYLTPKYSLTYDNQEISQLSPGERGLLLLVFYLLVDKDDIPLVIDQPEENLDNQTIYKILVRCIKAAKQRRQVVMVTHNPNLAVVCDAEQIICATCDKVGKQFSYISGAIESPIIKERVIEILEGTQPAFVNRRDKYGL
jgi:ABC-type lipoprotein export system ATPase subunit